MGGGTVTQSMPHITSSICGESTLSKMDDSVGGVNDPDGICKTIRVGGRNDIHKKHSWDLVYEEL